MASLLLKDLPADLHRQLQESARRDRRSMNRQAIVLIEKALRDSAALGQIPEPVKGRFPISEEFLRKAKRTGRS